MLGGCHWGQKSSKRVKQEVYWNNLFCRRSIHHHLINIHNKYSYTGASDDNLLNMKRRDLLLEFLRPRKENRWSLLDSHSVRHRQKKHEGKSQSEPIIDHWHLITALYIRWSSLRPASHLYFTCGRRTPVFLKGKSLFSWEINNLFCLWGVSGPVLFGLIGSWLRIQFWNGQTDRG